MKEFKSFYKTVEGNEGQKCHYPTRLDTYGCGCQHDCQYCYAKSLLEFRDLWNNTSPSVADITKIESKIKSLKRGSILRLGGMTDCFQPCEKQYKVTYKTIQLLNKYGIHYLIVTKSDLVASNEYVNIMDKSLAHIQITVTSTDDNIALTYEKATPPSKRIQAIEKLEALGFDVQIRLSPFIPQYIDIDVISKVKCKRAIVEFLRANTFIKRTFNLDYSDFTHKEGGYYHLPLEKKKSLIQIIAKNKEVSVCEDCGDAYEYWRNNINPFPEDCCNLRFDNNIKHMGNMDLLRLEKIAFLSSAIKSDDVVNRVEKWLNEIDTDNTCIISGFQSEVERLVLDNLLKTNSKIIFVMAKKMFNCCPQKYKEAIEKGRMLIIAPNNPIERVVTKQSAKQRNLYVINHAQKIVVGNITPNGMIEELLNNCKKPMIKLT